MLQLGRRGHVLLVRFGDPDKLNALDEDVLTDLRDLVRGTAADDYRVLVLGGNGTAFSAGGDLNAVLTMRGDETLRKRRMWLFREVFDELERLPCVTIAAVDGPAFGGGLELLLACDLGVASDRSTFGDGHINVGLVAGGGGTQRLPRLVGTRRALFLALSGKGIDANTAQDWGLINGVFPAADFWAQAWEFAGQFAIGSRATIARLKSLVRRHDAEGLAVSLAEELKAAEQQLLSDEAASGVRGFLDRRGRAPRRE
jgi:enoyl-CoA hydratase/carnithine racemase